MRRVRLEELLGSPDERSGLVEVLARGGVAAIPTDTFYALACDPSSERGVARIFQIKRRDDGKPLPVLFSSRADLDRLGVEAAPRLLDRLFRLWPAPLTVVLPLRSEIAASRGSRTLAVRIPAAPAVRRVLDSFGPLTGTSANRSGQPPIFEPGEIVLQLGDDVDLLIDGGTTPGGAPSTIIDATMEPLRVLRAGAFAWKDGPD